MGYLKGNYYISTLGNKETLSTNIITLKLATLLAISSSNRALELTYLDITFRLNSRKIQ